MFNTEKAFSGLGVSDGSGGFLVACMFVIMSLRMCLVVPFDICSLQFLSMECLQMLVDFLGSL